MALSLQPHHLKRYKDIARLLLKYGRSDVVKQVGVEEVFQDEDLPEQVETDSEGEHLASDLESLGPTFIKLGQLLSTRTDLLPPSYLEALSRLQDKVEPFPIEEVEEIISVELGVRLSKAFPHFDREPLAAASLGQVHKATLRDGRPVAVKVQRPRIREHIRDDLEALDQIATMLEQHTQAGQRYELTGMLEEFRQSLARELDYRREAANLAIIGRNLAEFDRIVVPAAIDDYTTSRVLTMEFITGRKVTKLSPLRKMEMDGAALAEDLFRAYMKQILVDGIFHADPHPGNVFITEENRIALIDLGMIAQLAPDMQLSLLRLILAIADGRGDDAADIAIQLGRTTDEFNEREFRREASNIVAQYTHTAAEQIEAGRVVLDLTRVAGSNGIVAPAEFAMLGKTLLSLDMVGRSLDPEFDPNSAIRRNAAETMRQRMSKMLSPSNMFSTLIETTEFVQNLPSRMNKVLETVSENQLRLKVDAIDEVRLMSGLQKIANRITVGLVLAALIIGAAMLVRVPTRWTIFGYPGLAILLFLIAAAAALILLYDILLHDDHRGSSPRGKEGA